MAEYIIHKAVDFSAVKVGVRKSLGIESVDDLATTHYLQRKYDGCNAIVKVTPSGFDIRSRTNEVVRSCNHIGVNVKALLSKRLERGESFAVLGEVWRADTAFADISGMYRRHNAEPSLQFVVFDMLTLDEFEKGESARCFEDRYNALFPYFRGFHPLDPVRLCETYNPGSYGEPTVLATHLVKSGGYDGAILRSPYGLWKAGSGTDGEIIKVKAAESYDLRVVDIEEGKGKYKGTLGALVCKGPKGLVKVSGMCDAQRDAWWSTEQDGAGERIVGAIVEVQCLGFTNLGSLREPRFKGVRFDKEAADFE